MRKYHKINSRRKKRGGVLGIVYARGGRGGRGGS